MAARKILIAVSIVGLAACADKGLDDLQRFTQEAHKDRKPRVEPLPRIRPYEKFVYTSSNLTDPFSAGNLGRVKPTAEGGLAPDPNRRKEPLEEFPLDSLRMVGTLSKGPISWAVIRAPDGTVHRATEGNYLGQNFGKIDKVTESKLFIIEKHYNGKWVERETNIAIEK